MDLELVPIRVKEVEGVSFAAVVLPDGGVAGMDGVCHVVEGLAWYGKGQVSVIGMGSDACFGIKRQADPVVAGL